MVLAWIFFFHYYYYADDSLTCHASVLFSACIYKRNHIAESQKNYLLEISPKFVESLFIIIVSNNN